MRLGHKAPGAGECNANPAHEWTVILADQDHFAVVRATGGTAFR